MLKLTIIILVGAFALTSLPALAADLPDYGSKNFSPSDDTPTYFTNESVPVSARTADTTERDWSAVDEMIPARSTVEPIRSGYHHSGRHGRFAFGRSPGTHAATRSGGSHSVARKGLGATGYGSAQHPKSAAVSPARATSIKHGRSGARHASAVVSRGAV
jgi:hypothetical protein